MHGQLTGEGFTLMASDAMPGAEQTWGGTRVYCSFFGDDLETQTRWFEALAAAQTPMTGIATIRLGPPPT